VSILAQAGMPILSAALDATDNAGGVTGPFTEVTQQVFRVVWDTVSANVPRDLRWYMILLTLFLGSLIFLVRRGHGAKDADGRERKTTLLNFLLPRDIYTHISARVDIWLWVIERILRPLWAVSLFATVGPFTEQLVIG
jgi:hypothetical protein